ncbi:MAG: ATP-dependent RNA helicase RhlB [Acidiferrobacterales bacterium]|nr:ATP-dependent RNA helicase RhlB [Acidiferrobacterales bacterium]
METTEILFDNIALEQPLKRGVAEAGFVTCTPIQAQALPLALAGRDVAGQAQTGTGKTAAFLLATFNHLLTHAVASGRRAVQPRALILAPTRELAVQIHRDAEALGRYAGFKLGLVYGGTGYESQRRQLGAGVDILIGTPGRLIDYFKQRVFDLKAVQVVVLDEADRMFDLGFIKDIRYLLRRMPLPVQRLGMLFSATLSYRVMELAYEHMNNPEFVRVAPDKKTVDEVQQTVYHPANTEKIALLVGLLRNSDPVRSLVFTNTKDMAERLGRWLQVNGINAASLTGDVPQKQRLHLLQQFTEGKLPVLVATDVAARGLHIPDVSHVFNFDLPQDPEDYVHRIGRTARAGSAGDAISFACEDHAYSLVDIEKFIGHKIPSERITQELLAQLQKPSQRPARARQRGRSRPQRAPNQGRAGQRPEPAQNEGSRRSQTQRGRQGQAHTRTRQPAAHRRQRSVAKPSIG